MADVWPKFEVNKQLERIDIIAVGKQMLMFRNTILIIEYTHLRDKDTLLSPIDLFMVSMGLVDSSIATIISESVVM